MKFLLLIFFALLLGQLCGMVVQKASKEYYIKNNISPTVVNKHRFSTSIKTTHGPAIWRDSIKVFILTRVKSERDSILKGFGLWNFPFTVLNNFSKEANVLVFCMKNVMPDSVAGRTELAYLNDSTLNGSFILVNNSLQGVSVEVCAHEFGHALGLDHSQNKNAIMWYSNEHNPGIMTQSDRDSLFNLYHINYH